MMLRQLVKVTDEVEGKKKRNLQEESLTKVASKQQLNIKE